MDTKRDWWGGEVRRELDLKRGESPLGCARVQNIWIFLRLRHDLLKSRLDPVEAFRLLWQL